MKALTLDAENKSATVQDHEIPSPGPNELLIAVKAIALNPVDALYTFQPLGSTGRVVGSDFAGLVVARGPNPTNLSRTSSNAQDDNNNKNNSEAPWFGSRLRRSSTNLSRIINRGDRVAGFLQGACSANDRPGAFAEYVVCPADLVWRIPGRVPYEEAAAVSLCGLTAAQGLFFRLGLDAPFRWEDDSDEGVLRRVQSEGGGSGGRGRAGGQQQQQQQQRRPLSFLVYGASTSVGMYVAQLVRRSSEHTGRRIRLIGAANPRNWDMLKEEPYAYDHLVDYRDRSWPEQVRRVSSGGVYHAYDAVSEGSTVREVSSTLREGGKLAVVRSKEAGAWQTEGVSAEAIYGAVWEGLGEDVEYHNLVVRTSPVKRSFAAAFYKWLSDGGLLQPNPVRVLPGGLEKVVSDGFALLGTGMTSRGHGRTEQYMRPISGEKLVYKIETERRGSFGDGHIA
ncbi:putative zinc-binding oxidoreductase [Diaporthe ampelina]|uniref:Putative zinc-binding oxidoreductase n=1 Tax=Diaporthe ampelina TaxID=1214573 RepID=A0A0G2I1I1_9PEZI|nr:putative zinc-binding oxidoreductase [Diaporthe ampelina]